MYGRKGRFLMGKPEGKRPLGKPRSRSYNDIKMDLLGSGMGGHRLD